MNMKIKILLLAIAAMICVQSVKAQQEAVKWLTFAEAEKLDSTDHRPFTSTYTPIGADGANV